MSVQKKDVGINQAPDFLPTQQNALMENTMLYLAFKLTLIV